MNSRASGKVRKGNSDTRAAAKMHLEMHKFKEGTLHSGSKHGPIVTDRSQAIAIGLKVSGQGKKKRR